MRHDSGSAVAALTRNGVVGAVVVIFVAARGFEGADVWVGNERICALCRIPSLAVPRESVGGRFCIRRARPKPSISQPHRQDISIPTFVADNRTPKPNLPPIAGPPQTGSLPLDGRPVPPARISGETAHCFASKTETFRPLKRWRFKSPRLRRMNGYTLCSLCTSFPKLGLQPRSERLNHVGKQGERPT